ncbi:MAG: UDP-N-acetylmuramoyl-tripeptide--D-alanyl-D-alanine ligase [Lachnospiraceae bacterium]|nr:UDP-N-acetylmuramoyl-tripeptide--D-alanyl-D-alanine ligase [Lachnospiraceae bacterium]
MNLTVRQIAEAAKGRLVYEGAEEPSFWDRQVDSVVLDSRQVTAGGVFVATAGERVDGHSFVSSVFEKGAVLAIVQRVPEETERWPAYLLVEDTLQALKDIAECYRKSLQIPIIGITGSVGKTSTKEFIAGVLSEKYKVLKTQGNYNNEIGVPLTLLRIRSEHETAVVEMGISDFGEMHRLSKMARPDIAVITNIGQCHLENLKDRDGVLKAKTEIFDFMSKNGKICLNGNDDKLRTVSVAGGRELRFFGLECKEETAVCATDVISKGLWGSQAVLHNEAGESYEVEVPLPGVHMVLNAAAAACVAELLGLTPVEIQAGLKKVAAVGGRNNLIRTDKFTLIDDCYNANPVSMKAGIDLLCMADTATAAILGDMFELGENSNAMHAEVGAYAAEKGVNHIICVGANSRHMCEAALQQGTGSKVTYFSSREELLAALRAGTERLLPEGSTILIKASHGMRFSEVVSFFCMEEEANA